METSRLDRIFGSDRRRDVLVIVLWNASIASVYLQALYQRAITTLFDDAIVAIICIIAGIALMDLGRVILGFFITMPASMALVYLFVSLPALDGSIAPPGDATVATLWFSVVFKLIFPAPFFLFLVSSIVGSLIGERYL